MSFWKRFCCFGNGEDRSKSKPSEFKDERSALFAGNKAPSYSTVPNGVKLGRSNSRTGSCSSIQSAARPVLPRRTSVRRTTGNEEIYGSKTAYGSKSDFRRKDSSRSVPTEVMPRYMNIGNLDVRKQKVQVFRQVLDQIESAPDHLDDPLMLYNSLDSPKRALFADAAAFESEFNIWAEDFGRPNPTPKRSMSRASSTSATSSRPDSTAPKKSAVSTGPRRLE